MRQLRWALDTIPNLKVLFVCPTFRYEATGKYNWLTQERYARRVTVFLKYKSTLCKTICERDPKKKGASRLWLILEDCGSVGQEFLNCPHARDLWGVARHLRCNITVLFHSLRGGKMLSPYIRANLNVITVFSVNSLALLKNIHEEILSLVDGWENFRDFKNFFLDLTASKMEHGNFTRSHNAITIDLSTRQVDANTKNFMFGQKPDGIKNAKQKRRRAASEDESDASSKSKKVLCEEEE